MKIRYKGNATVRTIMQYRWDKSNGFVCDVPDALAANLLTYPRPDFVLAEPNKEVAEKKIEKELGPTDEAPKKTPRRRVSRLDLSEGGRLLRRPFGAPRNDESDEQQ